MPSGAVPSGTYGVGAAVTKPNCPEPPSNYSPFQAPGTVVKDIDGLEPGTNHGTAADKYAYPASVVNQWLQKPSTQPKNKKIVFVTFDDGPTTKFTGEQLDNLEKAGARATFFMIAPQIRDVNKNMLTRSLKMGNALAIHSYSHDYKYLYHGSAADKAKHISCDWDWAIAQNRAVLGSDYFSSAFRHPGGHMSWSNLSQSDAALAKRGVSWIDWNAMSGDADVQRPTTVPGYLEMVKKSIKESDNPNVVVILNHDTFGKQMTAEAMPSILSWLKSQGYEFGVIS
ncbi:polysaccharide deacetylase [Cutibacterium sp. WCA-380-WT-3A]|uniref:Polysaccharide deacetylase n=1 Tax=Cutibacterium porci TaxID=2605781 RepID=A0A7K0J526_9ACTN|nr:polysaccharide deacetylase [Cutibacterium porci]